MMKAQVLLTLITFIASLGAQAEVSMPIQVTCGNMEQGSAIKFALSPVKRIASYQTFKNGVPSETHAFGPSHGIYDAAKLTFSGHEDLKSSITVHGFYAQIVRINHYASFTLTLDYDDNQETYVLWNFSSGAETTSQSISKIKESAHSEFSGLHCAIVGI